MLYEIGENFVCVPIFSSRDGSCYDCIGHQRDTNMQEQCIDCRVWFCNYFCPHCAFHPHNCVKNLEQLLEKLTNGSKNVHPYIISQIAAGITLADS